jgi:hypothetical protein
VPKTYKMEFRLDESGGEWTQQEVQDFLDMVEEAVTDNGGEFTDDGYPKLVQE